MLQDRQTLIEQVRRLAMPLSSSERLALIRAIASLGPTEPGRSADASSGGGVLAAEQEAWFARPHAERNRYAGEYVAVHEGKVVDHDPNQRAIYLRARSYYGNQPVLIVKADWDTEPEFTIRSPQLEPGHAVQL